MLAITSGNKGIIVIIASTIKREVFIISNTIFIYIFLYFYINLVYPYLSKLGKATKIIY